MARQPKPEQQQVFKYLEEHPDIELKELKKVFPEKIVKYGSLRLWFISWQNSQQDQPEHKQESEQLDIQTNHISEPQKEPDSDLIAFLNVNRDALEKIISLFKQDKLSLPDDKGIDVKAPFQPANFSLMKSLFDEFKVVAELQGISQRQGIHRALKLYVDTFQ